MISYEPLLNFMYEHNLEPKDVSTSTIFHNAVVEGKSIQTDTLSAICSKLQCNIGDVICWVDEDFKGIAVLNDDKLVEMMNIKNMTMNSVSMKVAGYGNYLWIHLKDKSRTTGYSLYKIARALDCKVEDICDYIQ